MKTIGLLGDMIRESTLSCYTVRAMELGW